VTGYKVPWKTTKKQARFMNHGLMDFMDVVRLKKLSDSAMLMGGERV
jgi:hypothetical protein